MSPRLKWPALGAALAVSAWLALFADKTPEGDGAPADVMPRHASAGTAPAADPTHDPALAPAAPAPRWQARSAQATAAWLAQPVNLFRPLPAAGEPPRGAPADGAHPEGLSSSPPSAAPVVVIGRSLSPGPRTVYLQAGEPGAEVVTARVGSLINGFQVMAIEAEAVVLRHRESGQTVSLPMGGPYGVF